VVSVSFLRRGFPPGGTATIIVPGGWGAWLFLGLRLGF
jgi:hypothetical protein